ncbi:MAG: ABC transporter substrate-binding protein [Spirochaetota bacterium]
MKIRTILAVALVVVFCFAAATVFAEKKEVAEGALEETTIILQYQPNPLFAAMSVALDKGYFEDVGFESVETKSFTSGNIAGEAMIAGELSVWVPGNMPVISMRHAGVPVVITGMFNVCPAEYLMVRDDAEVEKPEDLKDIKIGLSFGSTAQGVLEDLARAHGIDPNKLNVVNLPPPEQVTALRNNETQALLVWPPNCYKVQDIASYRFQSKKYSHTNVPMVFAEWQVRKQPNTCKAIMEALYRGQEFCAKKENWEEAQKIHARMSDQPLDIVKQGWADYWNPDIPNGHLDRNFVKDFEAYTQFQKRVGRIEPPIQHVLEYTYTEFLEEIRPEYAKVEGKWTP